jgi:enoyl-CoA hydratase/carnithine racemase
MSEAGSNQMLTSLIGHRKTMEIFQFGKLINAKDALAYDLVNATVPIDQLHETSLSAVQRLAALLAECVYETKRLTRKPPAV